MALRSKRVFTSCFRDLKNSFLCPRTEPARRNAQTIWPDYSFFSSLASNTPSFQLSNKVKVDEEDLAHLLRGYGLSDTDISVIGKRCPSLYRPSHWKSVPSRLQFLESIGLSRSDVMILVKRSPFLLSGNFEYQVIPCYNYFKNLPMDDGHLIKMLKDNPGVLLAKVETVIAPNIELLRDMGIPDSSLTSFVVRDNNVICRNHERFKMSVELALSMGLGPEMKLFLHAVRVLSKISKQTWDQKVKVLKSFGFSDDDVVLAFKKQPYVMSTSEKKMEKVLEFALKELRLAPEVLANDPNIFLLNFERRVVPRCRVMEILREKGLLKRTPAVMSFLKYTEKQFVLRFIESHKYDLPELMDIYSEASLSLK